MSLSPSFVTLRQQIDNFQTLLAAAAASSSNVRNYDIRHCLRQIQSCLASQRGNLLYEQNETTEVTDVLMTLLALNDEYDDPMILGLVNAITQRAAALVSCYAQDLSTHHIQELLPRILFLLQNNSNANQQQHQQVAVSSSSSSSSSTAPSHILLLQLINQHITTPSRLQEVFDDNDLDCWITLQTVLVHQQPLQSAEDPMAFLSVAIFLVTLLHYVANNVLPLRKLSFSDRIHSQLLLQQDNHDNASSSSSSSPSPTKETTIQQLVGEYLDCLEQFGVCLFESSLHLLEQNAHDEAEPMDTNNSMVLMTLQYCTVATDCLQLCLPRNHHRHHNDGMLQPPLLSGMLQLPVGRGIVTSLWQALTCLIVQQLEPSMEEETSSTNTSGCSSSSRSSSRNNELQLAATEALWQLTLLATTTTTTTTTTFGDSTRLNEQSSCSMMMIVTILRLLQHPDIFWTHQAQEWLQVQLNKTSSSSSPSPSPPMITTTTTTTKSTSSSSNNHGTSLRRALQAITLSHIYHRSTSSSGPNNNVALMLHEALQRSDDIRSNSADDDNNNGNDGHDNDDDPWQLLVEELLSEHLTFGVQ